MSIYSTYYSIHKHYFFKIKVISLPNNSVPIERVNYCVPILNVDKGRGNGEGDGGEEGQDKERKEGGEEIERRQERI